MATKEELAKAALQRLAAQKAALDADTVQMNSDVVPQQSDVVQASPELIDESTVPALQDDIIDPEVAKAVAKSTPKIEIPVAKPQVVQQQPVAVIPAVQPTTAIPASIAAPNLIPASIAAPTLPPSVPVAATPTLNIEDIGGVKQAMTQVPQQPVPITGDVKRLLSISGFEGPPRPSPLLPPEQQPSAEIEPTFTQVQQEYKKQIEPIQKAKAQVSAAQKIKEQLAADQERKQKQDENVQKEIQKQDEEVRMKSLPEIMKTGGLGEKLGVALAIMVGGIGQGLLGSKTNAALDTIDKLVEQQAAKDKLKLQEKEALKEAAYKEAMMKIEQAKQATNDFKVKKDYEIAQQQLRQEAQKVALKRLEEAQQKELTQGMYSGKSLTPEQLQQMSEKQRDTMVILPDIPGFPKNRRVLVNRNDQARDFDAVSSSVLTVDASLKKLEQIQDKMGVLDLASPAMRAEIEAIRAPLAAALRIPYTGTGPLTEAERAFLDKAISNPASFFNAFVTVLGGRSPEKAKLDAMRGQVYLMLQEKAKSMGINEQIVPITMYNDNGRVKTEKQLVSEYAQKNPGVSEEIILKKIRKLPKYE